MQRHTDNGGAGADRSLPVDAEMPLIIDAETTVSEASLLTVALFAYLKSSAWQVFRVARWLLRGRLHLERKLVEAGVAPDVRLPLNPELTALTDSAAAEGRAVYLAVARGRPLLEEVASRHSSIAGVIVDEGATSPKARLGSLELRDRFPGGYDAVIGRRGRAEVVRHEGRGVLTGTAGSIRAATLVTKGFPSPSVLQELVKSLRVHQCVKNLIVFVPVILGGRLTDLTEVADTFVAFIALSLVASGTYLFNDIWDLSDDRKHWSKRYRPIASGRLPPATALMVALAIIPAGLGIGVTVSWATGSMLLLYLAVTLMYTLHLKTVPFLDGLVLATLFTIRLGIGAVAAGVPPSAWLFVFSMFLFASLSYAKRHTEIARAMVREEAGISGRGYRPIDAPMVLTVGLATGVGAVMIMVLYIVEEAFRSSFYGSTGWLWGFPPLVFLFILRIWLVSARGEMNDDPVAFAVRDRISVALLGLLLVCFGFAWLG